MYREEWQRLWLSCNALHKTDLRGKKAHVLRIGFFRAHTWVSSTITIPTPIATGSSDVRYLTTHYVLELLYSDDHRIESYPEYADLIWHDVLEPDPDSGFLSRSACAINFRKGGILDRDFYNRARV